MKWDKTDDSFALRWAKKIKGINLLGGKCKRCGNNDIVVLEFHHLKNKDINIGMFKDMTWEDLEPEIKKCEILCSNCHKEEHYTMSRGSQLKVDILSKIKRDIKCCRCGYVGENLSSLCFHHIDPLEKNFNISYALARKINGCSIQDIIDEINKCEILCSNCHSKEHFKKDKFEKMKNVIGDKVTFHKGSHRIDENTVRKLKNEGKGICEIAKIMKKGKSSIYYAFHRV